MIVMSETEGNTCLARAQFTVDDVEHVTRRLRLCSVGLVRLGSFSIDHLLSAFLLPHYVVKIAVSSQLLQLHYFI